MSTGDPYHRCAKCGNTVWPSGYSQPLYWVNGQYLCSSCYYANYAVQSVYVWSSNYAYALRPVASGWTCPKCGRVWGNQMWGCCYCNNAVTEREKSQNEHSESPREVAKLFGWDYDKILEEVARDLEGPNPIQSAPIPKPIEGLHGCSNCKYGEVATGEQPCCECLRNEGLAGVKALARDRWMNNELP